MAPGLVAPIAEPPQAAAFGLWAVAGPGTYGWVVGGVC